MSKTDAMRAMREARYEQAKARAAAKSTAAKSQLRSPHGVTEAPADPTAAERPVPESTAPQPAMTELEVQPCGHRAISGRTCTREHGHAAKSHRYS